MPGWGRTGMAVPVLSVMAAEKVSSPTGGPAVISGRYTNVTHYSYHNISDKNSAHATLTHACNINTMRGKKKKNSNSSSNSDNKKNCLDCISSWN